MTQIPDTQSAEDFAKVWEETHLSNIPASNVRHADVMKYLSKLREVGVESKEVGRSFAGREICQVEWGKGPTKILMWSQMHGDEPTATSALFDMFAFLAKNKSEKQWVEKLEESVSIRAVPMLNPDGAELFQRRNLQFIDINRDARSLETPEGRLLKQLRDDWDPDIGFNLHNQNELTSVGKTFNQATNSLLAVSGRADGSTYQEHERNRRLCTIMVRALNRFIEGKIGRYDDSYNPRAFGDMIAAWGTPVILIETGGFHGMDESFLIKLNFVAYLTALQSLADGTHEEADPQVYEWLPFNSSDRLFNYIIRGGSIVNFAYSDKPFVADIAINRERRRADQTPPVFVQEVGDLEEHKGLDEYDATGYFVVVKSGSLSIGSRGHLLFYKCDRDINWHVEDLEKVFSADGEFKDGNWIKEL
ncbi:MAG: peptidase M14 [Pyrinomonadaceae bacterium]|nr:peptidase M14 [Pyrinomonadaceae bacterium]